MTFTKASTKPGPPRAGPKPSGTKGRPQGACHRGVSPCRRWPVCRRRGGCPCYAMMSCNVPGAGRATACRHDGCTSLLLINQPLVFFTPPPYPATARLRACRSIARQPIAAVHEYLPMCTRVYAHALRAATDSVTSIFDHEQIARPRISVLVVKSRSNDTSKCAVGHNCLRTRAVLTLCQNPTQLTQ